MQGAALRALEFDRIVASVVDLAVTPPGRARLAESQPSVDVQEVAAALRATSEGTRFLAEHPGFPLRAPSDLIATLEALGIEGRGLEALRLVGLADYLQSIDETGAAIRGQGGAFPVLAGHAGAIASFAAEVAQVRRTIEPSGEVADRASPALSTIRDRLRRQKQKLRTTLEAYVRGPGAAKYLQDQVITDRNGRHVLMVRAEHRQSIPGIVHGGSTSGATLFVEPLETVEINNDIVALEEQEAEEVRRILLHLTHTFRARPDDLERTVEVATALDVIQARARFSQRTGGTEPELTSDGTLELLGARHPLLRGRESFNEESPSIAGEGRLSSLNDSRPRFVIPVDIRLIPPTRVLVITGPNTGGKTVALKTAGLLAAMAQAGLHVPAEAGSKLPVFRSLFADIGDEQSISASLSTFSAHIANLVSMDRELALPALVLLDEIGAGTDPVEGGALGIAVIERFRARGAHLVATTHYDSLKSYASTTPGVESAAFGFDPQSFAPTYRLVYGSPGRSLALEIAARLGMPAEVIEQARGNLSDPERQLAEHLARVDEETARLDAERHAVARERAANAAAARALETREAAVRERELASRKRLDARLDAQLREARGEIDAIIEGLRARVAQLAESAAGPRLVVRTGQVGSARAEARAAVDRVVEGLQAAAGGPALPPAGGAAGLPVDPGSRVAVGGLGVQGTVIAMHGTEAEVDVRGKRLRVAVEDLRPLEAARARGQVRVRVDLQPREGGLADLNVVGCTVDEALDKVEKFLDQATVSDQAAVRVIHGHGTGKLRKALAEFLAAHPLVSRFQAAPANEGGSGATVVELKD